jgi:hypothetical protein
MSFFLHSDVIFLVLVQSTGKLIKIIYIILIQWLRLTHLKKQRQ